MEKIYRNHEVLEITNGSYIIHDASVTKFNIFKHGRQLCIEIYFTSAEIDKDVRNDFKLILIDVLEYSFYWNLEYSFYTIESYKFLKTETGFYICLDPDNNTSELSVNDQDYIFCKEIEGVFR